MLRTYKLDLIQAVVANAVTQKSPQGYPKKRIQRAFSQARWRAEKQNRQEPYLERLLAISQRLEKIQALNEEDLQKLLEGLVAGE